MEKNLFSGEELSLLENLEIMGGLNPGSEMPDATNFVCPTNSGCPNFSCKLDGSCNAGKVCS